MSIQALRERKEAIARDMRNQLANKGSTTWSAEEQKKYDELGDEVERINDQIAAWQRQLDADAEEVIPTKGPDNKADDRRKAIVDKWVRNGDRALTSEEWEVFRNTMSTTTPSEGGFTVKTNVMPAILDAIKSFSGIRDVATVISTADGAQIQYPTSDGTAEEGEIIAENATATDADPNVGVISLSTYKFSSKVITVPIELLQDSSVDIEAFLAGRLRTRVGRIQNRLFTLGTGTGQPLGLIPAITIGKTAATGGATSVSYDDLVDLQESIDEGYGQAGGLGWMFHQNTRRSIRKLKDTAGRPIWTPGYESGISKGAPDELLGAPITINNHMATMAANADSIAFGDFSKYIVRDVMEYTLFRFTDSAYAKKGQVGFLAWVRAGGTYADVGGAVKKFRNSAT